jgi:hypothetical protein
MAKLLLLIECAVTVTVAHAAGGIDFRNLIPGRLDAPVYEADGVTRLAGSRYSANLLAIPCWFPDRPPPEIFNGIALSRFQTGELAGYWVPEMVGTSLLAPPGAWVWVKISILDQPPDLEGAPLLVRAETEPVCLRLGDVPVSIPIPGPIVLDPFPAVIDFRNDIPGILDAPIYEWDGRTRLEHDFTYNVRLFVDLGPFEESGPGAMEPLAISGFQSGDRAGYWFPKKCVAAGKTGVAIPGQRVWARLEVSDHWGNVPRGSSEPFPLELTSLTPLLGMKSFSLDAPPPEIDFRNQVLGYLDAPVFRADGTNRLSGDTGCWAALYCGLDESDLRPVATLEFGTGERAGYVISYIPEHSLWSGYVASNFTGVAVLGFANAGDRVCVQVRAWEHRGGWTEVMPPPRFQGQSEVFSLIVGSTPTPLVGLKSFSLQPASIYASHRDKQLVLRWSAGDGTVNYALEEATTIHPSPVWRVSPLTPVLEIQDYGWSWVADWVATNTVPEPEMFYRVRLLNP